MTNLPMHGKLNAVSLLETLSLLASYRKSGALTLRTMHDQVTIYFDRGAVRSVSTNDNAMRIGEVLMQLGHVAEEQIEQALALQSVADDPERIGEVLLDIGYISESEISQAIAQQIQTALVTLLRENDGTFEFTPLSPSSKSSFDPEISFEPLILNATYLADRLLKDQHDEHVESLPDTIIDDHVIGHVNAHERALLQRLITTYNQLHALAWRYGEAAQQVRRSVERLLEHVLARISRDHDESERLAPPEKPVDYEIQLIDRELDLWTVTDLTRSARLVLLFLLNGGTLLSALTSEHGDLTESPDRAIRELVSAKLISIERLSGEEPSGNGDAGQTGSVSGGSGAMQSSTQLRLQK
ncbi:MAG: DUF4388 domain-containing protein [Thermomicrobiaceae bacterium]